MNDSKTGSGAKTLMDLVKAAKAQIKEVDSRQAQELIANEPQLLVVDVREPAEYDQGHLEDALLVPRGTLEPAADPEYSKHVPELSGARQRPVLLYCATGGRSAMAAATLQLMGFERVYNLDGGFSRWQEEGRPVVRPAP